LGVFGVLNKQFVERHEAALDQTIETDIGLSIKPFAVPGKVALYLEEEYVAVGEETESTVGLEISNGKASFFYVPGCSEINQALLERVSGASLLFFDGTTFTDGEMVDLGLSHKTAQRMGHVAMSGEEGSLNRFAKSGIGRKIFIHINNTNPVLIEDSSERQKAAEAGWEIAYDGMEVLL